MAKFRCDYIKQLPGWDEFGKTQSGDIVVEASSKEEAEKVANASLGKYCVVMLVKELP